MTLKEKIKLEIRISMSTLINCYDCFGKITKHDVIATRDEMMKMVDDVAGESDKYRWHDLRKNPDDLPKCEHVVDIAFEAYGGKIRTARAFYEDGKMNTEDTCLLGCGDYGWDDWCEYCEETDDYIIPEGWFESVKFGENCSVVDRNIIAWREIEPFEEE